MTQSKQAPKMELLSKISLKSVYGAVDIKKLHEGKTTLNLMRVLGIASGVKTGQSSFGDWLAFTGNFKAIDLTTGNEFRSGKIFLPAIASGLIEGAIQQAEADSVQFAFDIGVKPVQDRQGKDSYEYTVTPLVEAQDNDPLNELENKLPALAAIADKSK